MYVYANMEECECGSNKMIVVSESISGAICELKYFTDPDQAA